MSSLTAGVPRDRVLRGIGFALLAYFLFSLMDATAKYLGGEGYSVMQLIFFRSLFGFLPVIPVVRADGGLATLRTRRPLLHLVRSLAVMGAITTFFIGIRAMPLAEALTLAFTGPLFMTLLSIPLLGETVGPHRLGAVLVGFCGVVVAMQPGADTFRLEAFYLIASGFCFALASVLTRRLGRTEGNGAIIFYSTLGQFLPAAILLPWGWTAPTDWEHWALFVAMGLVGGVGLQCMTLGFRYAPASLIAPFEYTALIWATLLGWAIWHEFPTIHVWYGAALLVASGLYIAWREAVRARRRVLPVA
jgi:drug/metabolite transporter (DMT)-like permease